jgi:hypothetical protein
VVGCVLDAVELDEHLAVVEREFLHRREGAARHLDAREPDLVGRDERELDVAALGDRRFAGRVTAESAAIAPLSDFRCRMKELETGTAIPATIATRQITIMTSASE